MIEVLLLAIIAGLSFGITVGGIVIYNDSKSFIVDKLSAIIVACSFCAGVLATIMSILAIL